MPAPRWLSTLAYTIIREGQAVSSFTLKVENDFNLAQNRYLGLYKTETPTAAYNLVNLTASGNIHISESQSLQWLVAINNLFDIAYQNHLSRLQYFEYYSASPNGRSGIYNMGRNIAFKVIIPF